MLSVHAQFRTPKRHGSMDAIPQHISDVIEGLKQQFSVDSEKLKWISSKFIEELDQGRPAGRETSRD